MPSLATASDWQRQRAEHLHREFLAIELAVAHAGARLTREIAALSARLADHVITVTDHRGKVTSTHRIKSGESTLLRELKRWRKGGRVPSALLLGYDSGGPHATMPAELRRECRRLASLATGGRNKDGLAPATFVERELKKLWVAGEHVPGLGTWQDWWRLRPETAALALPESAPDFPFSGKTIKRHCGHTALRKLGNVGMASAIKELPYIERDYSQLRKAELFTLDDARVDIVAINEFTGQTETVKVYLMMEVASRLIPAFVLRSGKDLQAKDVRALVSAGLAKTGLGVGYPTTLLFERGTLACSDELKTFLEGVSEGRIKVRRTGIIEGVRWIGAAADKARGNAAHKAVIESFIRSLHYRLLHLPGQRGNNRENTPGNLAVEDRDQLRQTKDEKRGSLNANRKPSRRDPIKDSLVRRAETLARFKTTAAIHGFACDITFPLLTVAQLEHEVEKALDAHNREPGHNYQGHHQHVMLRGPGGTWEPLNNIAV